MPEDNEEFWRETCRRAEARCENQTRTIGALRYAGNELARVLSDIDESGEVRCAIAKAVIKSTLAKWHGAKTSQ